MVLGGKDDFGDVAGFSVPVADGHLGLGVGAEPGQFAADFAVPADQQMGEMNRHGHQRAGFAGGVSEHDSLVAGAVAVHALGDVGGLGADGVEDGAVVEMEAVFGAVVSDFADDLAGEVFHIHPDIGAHFAGKQDHSGFHQRFAGDADGAGVLLGADRLADGGVQHGVGDLVGDFVRMPGRNRFGGEKKLAHCGKGTGAEGTDFSGLRPARRAKGGAVGEI